MHRKAQNKILSQIITAGALFGLLSAGFIAVPSGPAQAATTHNVSLSCPATTLSASPSSLTVAVGDEIRVSSIYQSTTTVTSWTGVRVVTVAEATTNNPYTAYIEGDPVFPYFRQYPVTGAGSMTFNADTGGCTGPGATVSITFTTNAGGGSAQAPQTAPAPQKQHVSTLDQTPAPGETVSMFGSFFDRVTEAFVGGVKVEIVSKSDNRVNIRMPRGLTGALDVELKSPLGTLLLPKHFTIGKLPAAGVQRATIIVGGFDHNSRKLTARMKARIDRWLERNSNLSTLTCTGFTSLPRRTTDVQLSTNRGTTACNYAKRQRPDVTTSVSQGVEDPRQGSNVRRVKLVLTQ